MKKPFNNDECRNCKSDKCDYCYKYQIYKREVIEILVDRDKYMQRYKTKHPDTEKSPVQLERERFRDFLLDYKTKYLTVQNLMEEFDSWQYGKNKTD